MSDRTPVSLDLVIPIYNESETLSLLFDRLRHVFRSENRAAHGVGDVRFLFIDDGSTDTSARQIRDEISRGLPATLLRFSRNFGHQAAVAAGLDRCTAQVTAVIDADLQDPPEVVLQMLGEWRKGFDVVYGVRRKRKEPLFKRCCYWVYYRLLHALSEVEVPMDSGDFCLMDRKVVQTLCGLPEKLRFARGLRAWVGFRQAGLEYERDARAAGESKYPFKDLYRLATDGIVSLSLRPLKLVQLCAFLFAIFFFLCLAATLWSLTRMNSQGPEIWFLISYTMSSLSAFFVLFSLFIICGYIGRMFFEIKGRPSFIVMEEIDAASLSLDKNKTAVRPLLEPEMVW